VLRHRRQAPRGNFEEAPLGVGLGQPPALDQAEVEPSIAVQQVLFALGQGWHAVTLRKVLISPNVAKAIPKTSLASARVGDDCSGHAPLAAGMDDRFSP
jgi:hypothetical protein